MNGRSEDDLVASRRKTDELAYTDLVKAYSRRVFAVCFGMLGDTHDAEDLTQQALLKGLTSMNQLRQGEQFGSWICQIAKNLCIDFIRRRKIRRRILLKRSTVETGRSKVRPELESAFTKLSEDYRIALLLYYFDGRSTQKIAESLGISRDAVHTRLSRARKQLRKLLEAQGDV